MVRAEIEIQRLWTYMFTLVDLELFLCRFHITMSDTFGVDGCQIIDTSCHSIPNFRSPWIGLLYRLVHIGTLQLKRK
jgi:hypothetical protein